MQYFRGKYQAGGTAISAVTDDGIPYYPISICLEGFRVKPPENQILIPKYNLPTRLYEVVLEDLVEKELCEITYGNVTGMLVELKANWKEIAKENNEYILSCVV